jgi:hypothetical protein
MYSSAAQDIPMDAIVPMERKMKKDFLLEVRWMCIFPNRMGIR